MKPINTTPRRTLGYVEKIQLLIPLTSTRIPQLVSELDKKYHNPDVLDQLAQSDLVRIGFVDDEVFKEVIHEMAGRTARKEIDKNSELKSGSRLALRLTRRAVVDRNEQQRLENSFAVEHEAILKVMLKAKALSKASAITRNQVLRGIKWLGNDANDIRSFRLLRARGFTHGKRGNGVWLTPLGKAAAEELGD